jgi:hypothetical protein
MGISRLMVEMILREHNYRAIEGDVVIIGRQTVYLSPADFIALLSEHRIQGAPSSTSEVEIDRMTIDRLGGPDDDLITDTTIFRTLGAANVRALDISPYEGAEVIHDLNIPVPESLRGICDFIVDGSTLDNTFNSALALQNCCEMLRPGGRLLAWNAFSPHNTPYSILPPQTWFDYFVANKFADCKIYVTLSHQHPVSGPVNVFYLSVDDVLQRRREMGRLVSPHHMTTLAFAEKGLESTADRIPIQQDYRSVEQWDNYCESLQLMQCSTRPHLARSNTDYAFHDLAGGYIYVDQNFRLGW